MAEGAVGDVPAADAFSSVLGDPPPQAATQALSRPTTMNCARCGLRASAVGISDGRATEDSFVLLDIGDISRLIDFVLGIAARAKPANQPTQHAVTTR